MFADQYLAICNIISYLSHIRMNVCHLAFHWMQNILGAQTVVQVIEFRMMWGSILKIKNLITGFVVRC